MKKLTAIIVLIIMCIVISPGYADSDSLKKFMKEVQKQQKESGRPEVIVESGGFILFMFSLEKAMKQFKFNKIKDTYEIKEVKKFDPPGAFHHEPGQRLEEALEIYGSEAV